MKSGKKKIVYEIIGIYRKCSAATYTLKPITLFTELPPPLGLFAPATHRQLPYRIIDYLNNCLTAYIRLITKTGDVRFLFQLLIAHVLRASHPEIKS